MGFPLSYRQGNLTIKIIKSDTQEGRHHSMHLTVWQTPHQPCIARMSGLQGRT
jgi:hypothetical protein